MCILFVTYLDFSGTHQYNDAYKERIDMVKKEHKPSGNAVLRAAFVAVALLIQVGWLLLMALVLNEYSTIISVLTWMLRVVVVLKLYSKHTNAAMKMPWIMLILVFPVMGLSLYLLLELAGDPGVGKRIRMIRERMAETTRQEESVLHQLEEQDRSVANQFRYLQNVAGCPVYTNTQVTYYPEGLAAFEAMKRDLEQAEKFIFMEYFIVEDRSAFRELQQILIRKHRQGVEVRLLYDDIGSVGYVNLAFAKRLNEEGIRCIPFNPALPVLNLFLNHRDHRKITVIDGKVGFTGGYNLADAYFDRERPYGKWKDTGLRLEGEAVRALTATFLELWCATTREEAAASQYLNVTHVVEAEGYVQPFGDNPLEKERLAKNVYMNLIARSRKSLYVITPYLIIPDDMGSALRLAAKRGVDVRIITPGIPDKKTVYAVTRSYYTGLVSQGVRIFEYTPGFCHAKQCICDGELAVIGTSNLDYRSLYHHFENDVLLYGCDAVTAIGEDFDALFEQCREVTQQYRKGMRGILMLWQCILRLFAPLM